LVHRHAVSYRRGHRSRWPKTASLRPHTPLLLILDWCTRHQVGKAARPVRAYGSSRPVHG
jgi:hypothetical protein